MKKMLLFLLLAVVFTIPALAGDNRFEAGLLYSYSHLDGRDFPGGWNATFAWNLHPNVAIEGRIGGNYTSNENHHIFLVGPRYQSSSDGILRRYTHFLVGVGHLSSRNPDTFHSDLLNPRTSQTSYTFAAGGGLDAKLYDHITLRILEVDLLHQSGDPDHFVFHIGCGVIATF